MEKISKKKNRKQSAKKQGRKKTAQRWTRYLTLLPALIWMTVIFYMSAKNGEASASMSGSIAETITGLLEKIRNDSIQEQAAFVEMLAFGVRKLAHMAEYGILFLCVYFAVKHLSEKTGRIYKYLISAAFAFFYACTDELHQMFVSGRCGTPVDVLIDMVGVLLTFLLFLAFQDKKWRVIAGILLAAFIVLLFVYLTLADFQ